MSLGALMSFTPFQLVNYRVHCKLKVAYILFVPCLLSPLIGSGFFLFLYFPSFKRQTISTDYTPLFQCIRDAAFCPRRGNLKKLACPTESGKLKVNTLFDIRSIGHQPREDDFKIPRHTRIAR